ncbi:hypothetical protein EJ05DRAFT_480168 [Pseudovirgaria hyperparasitica]|uniref:MHD domain-containing protein n=1 Tax=Pseudovirgaria hyperparasitica TaxID=470096 RepID=A0A6A6VVE1_9PEZI|nr:uncharacterized protein EJ05DRAFT_480168 [Pseudovirgaria hyperparasitica]KAF2753694.1 hypothetical protein EJ05DRAFT_480168 [Pseudovirgaria hyperparasitica]
MDLQRKEYPAMLENLQPSQAVNVLNDRIRHVSNVNTSIAEWLKERRRVEEQYVLGLRRLAQSLPADSALDLGVFTSPWNKIISSIEAIAESHHTLATKIEIDVELPLRAFVSTNREVQAMGNISGNLAAMAKEIDTAQKKAEKLENKGGKASASKVSSVAGEIESAQAAWDSQAPYVFEQLQAVDESRLNKLRDALTQLQTYEVDQVERNRTTAEQCLNVLLDVETADEIKTFSIRATSDIPRIERQRSRPQGGSSIASASLAPPMSPSTPEQRDDGSSHKGSIQEPKSSSKPSGLKRFTTVLGRRRQSIHPYEKRGPSPEQKSSGNLASSLFGRRKDKEAPQSPERQRSPTRQLADLPESSTEQAQSPVVPHIPPDKTERPNGLGLQNDTDALGSLTNGAATTTSIPRLQEPLQPISPSSTVATDPRKDSEGFTVPTAGLDAISQAEQEAAGLSLSEDAPSQQFKVDIRNAPIQEEDGDANAAIANVTNTLRAQAIGMPSRKAGTVRGRRAGDVRNTMFVPAGQTLQMNESTGELSMLPSAAVPQPTTPTMISLPTSPPMPSSQVSPFKISHRPPFLNEDPAGSDTQSIRSGRSLSSSASTTVRHPELHEPGLNSSIVETVSTWFERGQVTRAMVIGQVALAYNPPDISSGPFGQESIRLENFPVLEKVAPNPAFIEQQAEHPGIYNVDLSKITKTSVAFHYQVHLNPTNQSSFSPLLLSPAWKPEPTQTSALLSYGLNPTLTLPPGTSSITLSNLVLVLRLDPTAGKPTHAQSKPVGNFSKDRSLIYWRLGDVTLSADAPVQQLRVRFFTDGEAKPGNVEARWELDDNKTPGMGSGLSVSSIVEDGAKATEADPFADEDEGPEKTRWKNVQGAKKITSGTYIASS